MLDEELARVRVAEAIETGLKAQGAQRSLGQRKQSVVLAVLPLLVLLLVLAAILAIY